MTDQSLGSSESHAAPVEPTCSFQVPSARPDDFLVVAIGASAGGLDACRKLLGFCRAIAAWHSS